MTALSPWPTSPVALANARVCLRDALGATAVADLSDARLDALGATAAAMVEAYSRNAPPPIKNEAVIRLAGWMKSEPATSMTNLDAGPVSITWRPAASRYALRLSGAMGLLSSFHRPRAIVLTDGS